MIVFVDLEHEKQRLDAAAGLRSMGRRLMVKYRLEAMAGQPCLIVRYDRVSPHVLRDHDAKALFVSGNQTDLSDYAASDLEGPGGDPAVGRVPIVLLLRQPPADGKGLGKRGRADG